MRNYRRAKITTLALTIFTVHLLPIVVHAAPVSEYWNGINKDGHFQNSSQISLNGAVKLKWLKLLENFPYADSAGAFKQGRRSNGLAIRDGKILTMMPAGTELSPFNASFGVYSVSTGELLNILPSPVETGGLCLLTGNRITDSDTNEGLENVYWNSNGNIYTAHGGDHSATKVFDVRTGGIPTINSAPLPLQGSNASGYFQMTNDNPNAFVIGGISNHSIFSNGKQGFLGSATRTAAAMKHYSASLLSGNLAYNFDLSNKVNSSAFNSYGYGIKLTAVDLSNTNTNSKRWVYAKPDHTPLGQGFNHCLGAPRSFLLGADGNIYYYGFYTTGSGLNQAPDLLRGTFLAGVSGSNGQQIFELPLNFVPSNTNATNQFQIVRNIQPQIAAVGKYLAIFHPQQASNTNDRAAVMVVDLETKSLIWKYLYPKGAFTTDTGKYSWGTPYATAEAVQMVLSGDSLQIVEPYLNGANNNLSLRVDTFVLASNASQNGPSQTGTILLTNGNLPISQSIAGSVGLRELAAVDGNLVGLLDYNTPSNTTPTGQTNQLLFVLSGANQISRDLAPIATISSPSTSFPSDREQYSDSPIPPPNQFDSGTQIQFTSLGSLDPDGGTLTYKWIFGDGTTSTAKNPIKSYASIGNGSPPTLTNYNVTLSVKDNEKNISANTTIPIVIRNLGQVATVALKAVADGYVDGQNSATKALNYGIATTMKLQNKTSKKGFVQFSLPAGLTAANIVDAQLHFQFKHTGPTTLELLPTEFLVKEAANNWTESTLTFLNMPPISTSAVATINVATNKKPDFAPEIFATATGVLDHVRNSVVEGRVSFEIEWNTAGSQLVEIFTRESNYDPELLLKIAQ